MSKLMPNVITHPSKHSHAFHIKQRAQELANETTMQFKSFMKEHQDISVSHSHSESHSHSH